MLMLILEDKLPLKWCKTAKPSLKSHYFFYHSFRNAVPIGYFLTKLNDLMGHEGDNNNC